MWIEYLTEIVPGLVILACFLLWWQSRIDHHALRREWSIACQELVSTMTNARSWDEAVVMLKAFGQKRGWELSDADLGPGDA